MATCLLALREASIKHQPIQWSADKQNITILGQSYPRKTLTPYGIKGKKAEFFPLDALVVFLEHEKSTPSVYFDEARKLGVITVSLTQKKELLQYLKGEVDTTSSIDLNAFGSAGAVASASSASAATSASGSASASGILSSGADDERAGKRQRLLDGAVNLKPVSEWDVADIMAEESSLQTHLSVLQVPKKNLSNVLELYHKATSADSARSKEASKDSKGKDRSSSSTKPAAPVAAPVAGGIPIIIVPAALSSTINMYNVGHFLENGVFESGERLRKEGAKKLTTQTISRSSYYDSGRSVSYQVTDDVSHFKDSDWDRVVGVFVSGQTWQFSDWPKKRWANPAAIFENICAFHLHFDDEALNANVLQWRTNRLSISKSKRHGDRGVVLDFWRILTDFVAARNSAKKLAI